MSAIPDDIRKAVRRCLGDWNHSNIDLDEAIARAIMAERESCAKIAFDSLADAGHQTDLASIVEAAILKGAP